eukprot:m51a1_g14730 hypothetical protein (271) ;mRNA; f:229502-230793
MYAGVPLQLCHQGMVDENIASVDIAEASQCLVAGTAGSISGVTLFSLVGDSFLEARGRVVTQSEPSVVVALDQLRPQFSSSVAFSQRASIQLHDFAKGMSGKLQWKAHDSEISCMHRHVPQGVLVSGSVKGDVCFWDLRGKVSRPVNSFQKHQKSVTGIEAISQHGLMTCSSDGFVNLWDLRRTSAPTNSSAPDRSPVVAMRHLTGSNFYAISTIKGLHLLSTNTQGFVFSVVSTDQKPGFSSLQWDLNCANLYVGSESTLVAFKPDPLK